MTDDFTNVNFYLTSKMEKIERALYITVLMKREKVYLVFADRRV